MPLRGVGVLEFRGAYLGGVFHVLYLKVSPEGSLLGVYKGSVGADLGRAEGQSRKQEGAGQGGK